MDTNFEEHCRRKFKERLEQLRRFEAMNAPDCVMALELRMVIDYARGFMGEDLATEELKQSLTNLRQRSGFCHQDGCGNRVAAITTHPPNCEQCDAKIETECNRMDADLKAWR